MKERRGERGEPAAILPDTNVSARKPPERYDDALESDVASGHPRR